MMSSTDDSSYPSNKIQDFVLTVETNQKIIISKNVLKNAKNYHFMGITFLIENFLQKKGAILNFEEEMNMQFQTCAFLSAFADEMRKENLPSLVLCAEKRIPKWHYHVTKCNMTPCLVNNSDFIDNTEADVYLVNTDSMEFAQQFTDIELFCVVIDDIDLVYNKRILRKLKGKMMIGLTMRNFYKNRNPKIMWHILNWANEGCVGKLKSFSRMDLDHFLRGSNPYRLWWLRISWIFCESYRKPSEEKEQNYNEKLNNWAEEHNLIQNPTNKIKRKRTNTRMIKNNNKVCILENSKETEDYKNEHQTVKKSDELTNLSSNEQVANTKNSSPFNLNQIFSSDSAKSPNDNQFLKIQSSEEDNFLHNFINNSNVHNTALNLESDDDVPLLIKENKRIKLFNELHNEDSNSDSDFIRNLVKGKNKSPESIATPESPNDIKNDENRSSSNFDILNETSVDYLDQNITIDEDQKRKIRELFLT